MTKDKKLLQRAHQTRGFHLGVHEILHEADPEFMEHYQQWMEFAYTPTRHLDKKTKEFIHIAADIARQTHPDHIKAHLMAAKNAGASDDEIKEVCTTMFVLGGTTSFMLAMEAWRRAFRPDIRGSYEFVADEPEL